jgi:cellulase/cellobiase CelA1
MNSFSAVIEAFSGRFAEAIGVEESHARTMKARDSIPSTRWMATVDAAQKLGVEGVTLDLLARLDAEKSRPREVAQ